MNHKVEKIKKGIYVYGFYPALFYLKELTEAEEYEKCSIVKQAMDEISSGREWYLSSFTDTHSMNKTLENILKNHSPIIRENMPEYIRLFKENHSI